jgi:predicted AlkP superfamily pyrophosphatase or phosphodiesterase
MHKTAVINIVGLSPNLIGEHTPRLRAFRERGRLATIDPLLPAVTCAAQATYLTGALPREHGIVANGWYFRELSEIWLWRQSNRLVGGEKVWEAARRRDPSFTCAQLFWWYNMYASVDYAVTPRPMYLADGRKLPDIHTHPASLRDDLQDRLGEFPLFRFWGPASDIVSSRWIADSALHMLDKHRPTLSLVYLPHLDYDLQRYGPNHAAIPAQVAAVDAICEPLIDKARRMGAHVVVLSEYGITEVSRPVHINRALRQAGWLKVRNERGLEQLDPGASDAFAVADHQLAHVYVARPELLPEVAACLRALPGVEAVLDDAGKRVAGLDHARSGELVAVAHADSWFTYYHFLDDARAPDFARTIEIHRKPGYDPVELFMDRNIRFPKLAVATRLAKKALGMRYLMDVIGLDATVIRGSHGRPTDRPEDGPLFITSAPDLLAAGPVPAVAVKQLLLDHLFGAAP